MNDLELVRELRAEIGSASPAQLARGRARLSDAIERPQRRRRRAPTLAIAATVAGVAAVAVLASGRGVGERARAPHLTLAAKVLHEAARAAAAASTVEPGAQQWIYTKAVDDEAGQGTSASENWLRFDGHVSAYPQDGQLVTHVNPAPIPAGEPLAAYASSITPMTAYEALAALPSSPQAMLAAVAAQVAANPQSAPPIGEAPPHATRAQLEFAWLVQLLWNSFAAAPPQQQAVAFQALALLPGVTVNAGLTAANGAAAIGVSDDGGAGYLLLDPRSYQVIGLLQTSTGHGPQTVSQAAAGKQPPYPPKGAVVESLAWDDVAVVDAPGQR